MIPSGVRVLLLLAVLSSHLIWSFKRHVGVARLRDCSGTRLLATSAGGPRSSGGARKQGGQSGSRSSSGGGGGGGGSRSGAPAPRTVRPAQILMGGGGARPSSPKAKAKARETGSDDEDDDDDDDLDAEGIAKGAYAKDSKLSDEERLQKVIARAGLASRRGAEALILDGRVVVNGKPVSELGTKVNAKKDIIMVDGKKLTLPDAKGTFWVMVNKPRSVLTTMDDDKKDKERRTVVDLVPKAKELRLVPVGSMERDSTGLMLLTNDVAWIHPLTHHSFTQSRRYEVVVQGFPEEPLLEALRKGIAPPPSTPTPTATQPYGEPKQLFRPCQVNIIDVDNTGGLVLLDLIVEETRPQQIPLMMETLKCPLVSVKRTGFGPLGLKSLRRGQWRELTSTEIENLKASCRKAAALPGSAAAESQESSSGAATGKGKGLGAVLRRRRVRKESKPGSGYAARTEHLRVQGSKVDGADGRGGSRGPRGKPGGPRGRPPSSSSKPRVWGGSSSSSGDDKK